MSASPNRIYRMDMNERTCPSGLKAKALLQKKQIQFDDIKLTSREETDVFKAKHDVKTTPQIWLDNVRIGGYDALLAYFGEDKAQNKAASYQPIIGLFLITALMALATSHAAFGSIITIKAAEWFISFSMCALAIQKFRDLDAFADQFITYDLLGKKWLRYAKIYPFAEALAGILMTAGALNIISIPIALFIGGLGAMSVIKAVYIDKRDLKCACVGGNSNVPLGFVSLLENIMMVLMAFWMMIMAS